jgi:hypothetical protein
VRFECSHCGKKYSSADEPTPGRVYVIGCKCGHSIVVKGPEKRHPAAAARAPAPPSAPPAPPPAARRSATLVTPPPSPGAAEAAPFPEAGARRGRAGPSLDPFADVQDFSGKAGARPLTDVPEIKGPIPEPTPQPRSFDPFAAQQGLLLEEDVARVIQGDTASPAQIGAGGDEVPVTFSEELPVAPPARAPVLPPSRVERAVPPFRPAGRSSRLAVGVAFAIVALAAAAGAWWFYFLRPSASHPPAPAPPAPVAAAPAPAPPVPKAAAPVPSPAPAPVAVQPPSPEAPPAPAPAPPPPTRAPPEREPPKRAAATGAPKKAPVPEPVVAAAPVAREPAPPIPLPPAPKEPPQREPASKPKPPQAAPDKSALDLPGAKRDVPPAPVPAAAGRRGDGESLAPADVEAAVKKNWKAFDGCVEDAVRNEPGLQVLSRRVGLYLTVNPSGIVTAPRLDDPELLDTEFGACLKSTARKMVFPQFQGDPLQVKVPLVLGRGE